MAKEDCDSSTHETLLAHGLTFICSASGSGCEFISTCNDDRKCDADLKVFRFRKVHELGAIIGVVLVVLWIVGRRKH